MEGAEQEEVNLLLSIYTKGIRLIPTDAFFIIYKNFIQFSIDGADKPLYYRTCALNEQTKNMAV